MKKNIVIWILSIALIFFAVYTVKNDQGKKDAENTNATNIDTTNTNAANTDLGTEQNITSDSGWQLKGNTPPEKVLAPDFTLKDLNGNEVSLVDYRGKNVYLNFWATWCPPCRSEMPEIEKLYQETKDGDLVILAIDIGEDNKTVTNFIKENQYNFKVLLDEKNEIASAYGISSIPVSLFIDKDGYIVNQQIGAMSLEQMKGYIDSFESN
ncbi:MAG: TlpA family protein disulfide reductase [Clostridiaceae bacterium]|nr:TlpA family protein disulfide reductase [Clostridiaceae bacterium]